MIIHRYIAMFTVRTIKYSEQDQCKYIYIYIFVSTPPSFFIPWYQVNDSRLPASSPSGITKGFYSM